MAQSKQQIQSLLDAAGSKPRHRFGQNFMIDQNLVRVVADAGELAAEDVAIEVGPGTGTLTEELLGRGPRVVAVEIDRDLAKMLREKFAREARFKLIEGDALSSKHSLNEELSAVLAGGGTRKLVAKLPYNIASPLIIEMLNAGVDLLAFTVQKEVADRLKAAAGSEAYGPLSVMAQMLAKVEVLRTLPPQAFWPPPKIDSSLVRLRRDDQIGGDAREFSRFVHQLFSFRRKTLRRGLAECDLDAEKLLKETALDPQARPEVLTPAQLKNLFDAARR